MLDPLNAALAAAAPGSGSVQQPGDDDSSVDRMHALRHTVHAHGAVSRYKHFSRGSRFCTGGLTLKFRPLGMGDPAWMVDPNPIGGPKPKAKGQLFKQLL